MISFFLCLTLLIGGYFVYGKFVDRTFGPDDRETPAVQKEDGDDWNRVCSGAGRSYCNACETGRIGLSWIRRNLKSGFSYAFPFWGWVPSLVIWIIRLYGGILAGSIRHLL